MQQDEFAMIRWIKEIFFRIAERQSCRMISTNPRIEFYIVRLNKKGELKNEPQNGNDKMEISTSIRLAIDKTFHHQVKSGTYDEGMRFGKINQPKAIDYVACIAQKDLKRASGHCQH